ncbi:VOC family protein [bacterium]|nr:VOC family protein [bacterium]
MPVKNQPKGYHTVSPYLIVKDIPKLVSFTKKAFSARVIEQLKHPDGYISHAEIQIGDSIIMIGNATADWKPMPTCLYIYVKDVDESFEKAAMAGAEIIMEPANQFYGDRNAGVKDSQGNFWWLATHIEEVSPEEKQDRLNKYAKR